MHWSQYELSVTKEWRLRARLTHINKAKRGCDAKPGGMSALMKEDLEREEKTIRGELTRRKAAASA